MTAIDGPNGAAPTTTAPDVVLDIAELRGGYGDIPVLHGISLASTKARRSASLAITGWARRRS